MPECLNNLFYAFTRIGKKILKALGHCNGYIVFKSDYKNPSLCVIRYFWSMSDMYKNFNLFSSGNPFSSRNRALIRLRLQKIFFPIKNGTLQFFFKIYLLLSDQM